MILCYIEGNMSEHAKHPYRDNIHIVLSHVYTTHFVLFLIGVSLDAFFHFEFFSGPIIKSIGILFLILASSMIFWAQRTSRNLPKEDIKAESFCRGPYRYTRSPTHFGLSFLVLGFGMVANAFFIFLSTLVAFIIAKFVFLHREEEILERKYGAPYLEYKNKVRF